VLFVALAATLGLTACQEQEFEPPDRAAQVERADSLYSPALFDTVTWASDTVRALEGNIVYSAQCRDCHGPLGEGGTEYARARELAVPSLVEPGWEHEGDVDAVRRQIFIGHPEGMPSWGIGRVSPRDIDAAAYYIIAALRPEVLGGGG
jgi:mono/diheme cytochrome c family protein